MIMPQQPNVPPMPKTVSPKEKKITRAQKDKDRLTIIKEIAKRYDIEVTECEQGEGGFYDGDKKIEFSEIDFWDGFSEDYFKTLCKGELFNEIT